jgi:hypothetical protein
MIDGEAGSTVQRQRGLSPRRMIELTLPWIAQRFSFYGIFFYFSESELSVVNPMMFRDGHRLFRLPRGSSVRRE